MLLFIIGATHTLHLKAMQGVGSRGGTTLKPFIIADCEQLDVLYPFTNRVFVAVRVTQSQSAVSRCSQYEMNLLHVQLFSSYSSSS